MNSLKRGTSTEITRFMRRRRFPRRRRRAVSYTHLLLENYSYDVIDLGKDVPPELIVETAEREGVKLVGLSALMTTTVPSMEETIRQLRKAVPDGKVMVGGAVLTEEYAMTIGADRYCRDAMASVNYAESVVNG